MDSLENELQDILYRELGNVKSGRGIGSLVGKLISKITPLIAKHAPTILGTLGLAAASGAVSGSTQRAVTGSGNYRAHGLMLTDGQKKKLSNAKGSITLRLTKHQLGGDDKLMLTSTQIKKIVKAGRRGVGMNLTLSQTQLQKQGGLIGALAAGLLAPALGKILGFGGEQKKKPHQILVSSG